MDYITDLHELCETLSREIAEANDKIRAAGGKLTSGDLDYVDKLTHAMKSVKATIAMMEDESGYSSRSYPDGMGGSYRGGSYRNIYRGSYARGRNTQRDSRGRYSSDNGYSRDADLVDQLHSMMQDAPNEQIRREMQRLAEKVEQNM